MNNNLDKKLNRDALVISKEHSGNVAIPTIVLSLLVVLIYSTVLFLFATKHLSPLLSMFFLIGITFASYIPMHEAVHGNIGGNNSKLKWLDRLIGYLMAPIIAIPFTSHQKEHFSHHKNTNKDDDPDVHIQKLFRSPKNFYKLKKVILYFPLYKIFLARWILYLK